MTSSHCSLCHSPFSVREADLEFLQRISPVFNEKTFSIPPPTLCPACREARRMAWRNEVNLFVRNCDYSGERLVSIYPPGVPFPVYRHREWFKDHNDATSLGKFVDPSRSFFDQLGDLIRQAPRFHVYNFQEELDINSQYTNCAGCNKNCYLVFASGYNEECIYGRYSNRNFKCVDTFFVNSSQCCYSSSDLENCDTVFFSSQCKDCSNSWFLSDCRGCHDCIGCAGLRQKSYCIFNEQLTREVFENRKRELSLHSRSALFALVAQHKSLVESIASRSIHGENNENSTGDYLSNTKNCFYCFDTRNAEDCAYSTYFADGKDCMDIYCWGEMELCYEISGGGSFGEYRSAFTANSYGCKECYYLDHCVFCEHCFGCVGLNRKRYCILNKQYSREEYEALVPQIIVAMQKRNEWGEFLPPRLSPFGYNHSVASDYYPLAQDDALRAGYPWSTYEPPSPQGAKIVSGDVIPDTEADTPSEYFTATIRCIQTQRLFKYAKSEIEFHRDFGLPLPQVHPEERLRKLLRARNPRLLWERTCSRCAEALTTSYSPESQGAVLCSRCYEAAMYG